MIIFYDNKSGEIYGMISGRVHDQEYIDKAMMRPGNIPVEQIAKYVVSFKKLTRVVTEDILEDQVDRATFKIIKNVKIGEREVEVPDGMECDDQFSEFFKDIEEHNSKLYQYKFDLDTKQNIVGIVKK